MFSEEGIKAAAATGIVMVEKSSAMIPMYDEYVRLTFDKPFMYVIRDKANGEIMFIGTVYEPTLHK